jgi:uncharacterized protein
METSTYTAFSGTHHIVTDDLKGMLEAVKAYMDAHPDEPVLIFEDETGNQIDFDFRGTTAQILARLEPAKPKLGPGRPSLGVVCHEVSLLPRHWEWLEKQQHNASASIRRLVDDAIKNESPVAKARFAIEATDRVMNIVAGSMPGCEEASRALYARNFDKYETIVKAWPEDLARYLCEMAGRAKVPA